MDITAIREHYEQLKRDIIEDGQSVNKDLDKFGSAPSGVALKFMYSGLDLKCNLLEAEFKMGFEMLLYFLNEYFSSTNTSHEKTDIDLVFNRNMTVNEAEQIENCSKSADIISDKTILANHPYVSNVAEELELLEEQRKETGASWDTAPIIKGEGDEE